MDVRIFDGFVARSLNRTGRFCLWAAVACVFVFVFSYSSRLVEGPVAVESDMEALRGRVMELVGEEVFERLSPLERHNVVMLASRVQQGGEIPAVCFSGDASPEQAWAYESVAAFARSETRFNGEDFSRWSSTATDGFGLGQGDAMTLTYSFVPDGISLLNGASGFGEPDTPSDLFADFDAGFGSTAVWQAHFASVFDTWSTLTGITYVQVSDDGANFPSSSGSLGLRGDIRIGGHNIDGGGGGVLAYNYFPNTGDMILDTDNISYYTSSSNLFRQLRNTVSHEHGHGLGFGHVCPNNQTKIMEPFLTTSFDHSALDDIAHANRKYGDPNEKGGGNDAFGTATSIGVVSDGVTTIGDGVVSPLSLDGVGDEDFYGFSVGVGKYALVTVNPVVASSTQFDQEPGDTSCSMGGPGSSLVYTSVVNLEVEIISTNGTTVLGSGMSARAGSIAVASVAPLPSGGTFFVRVSTSDAEAVPAHDQVQLYEVSLLIGEGTPDPVGLWVDFGSALNGVGSEDLPFDNVSDAVMVDTGGVGATVLIAPGSSDEIFAGGASISNPVSLVNTDSGGGLVVIGAPGARTSGSSGFVSRGSEH